MIRYTVFLFFFFLSATLFAQQPYFVHFTIDKVILGNDSVVFKTGKTFFVETKTHTDTIEVAKVGGIPVAIVVDVRKAYEGPALKYQIGYSWYKKLTNKWELIHNFGYVSRTDLVIMKDGFEKKAPKINAHDEYHCSIGQPEVFEAYFKMDVYKK